MKENHRKRIAVSWLLAIMMLITCIPATAFADSTSGWNGEPAAEAPAVSESGGISWYQIEDAADLAWFASEINNGTDANAVLTSDIDLNGQNWTAIGTEKNPFKGKFDGKGHSISNLSIDASSGYQGLFGYSSGTISNVDIKSGQVTNTASNTGSLVGINNAGGIVENCSSAAVVTDNSTSRSSYFGGLVGNNSGTITKSSFTGTVQTGNETIKQKNFGGIAGYMSDADAVIKGCVNTGSIKAYESVETGNTIVRTAGIVGNADRTDHGIVPADIDGYDPMGSALWRTFRSSAPSVIAHENLLYKKPEYDTKVTVDSCLTSETYARYAEKYPDNETFQKLYRQPVSVTVTVKGEKSGEEPAPEKFSVSFAMMGDTAHKEGEHKAYIQWIAAETSTVEEGTSVMDLTKTVLDKNGFKYTGGSNYINSITSPDGTTLSGTGNGKNSGWMYRVNGKDGEVSADNYILKKGDTVLWYYTDDYEKEYTIGVGSVSISETSATVAYGKTLKLTAEVAPAYADDRTVTWKSSDESIATVSKDGKVKALKTGNVTITAAAGDKSASCSIRAVPASPAKFKARSAGTTSVKLTWGKAAGADKYKVYRATSARGTYKLLKTTSAVSLTDKKLTTGKAYYYKVRALSGKNFYSSYTTVAKVKPVPAKTTLTAKSGKKSTILTWKKVSDASGYKVYRATKKNGSYKRIFTTTKTKVVNKSLKKGKTYYYKVRAYKTVKGNKIYGAYSAVQSAKAK